MGLKLLIADDEDTIRRGMTKYMQLHTDRFSKIYEAENGQEALDILLQYQPQVMLLDVQMPGKSGIEVLQEAKRAGIEPITIILSGYDEFKYAQQALHLGAKEYLLKPVRAADILACINQLTDEAFGTEGEAIEQEFAGQESFPADCAGIHCRAFYGGYFAFRCGGESGNFCRILIDPVFAAAAVQICGLPESDKNYTCMHLSGTYGTENI